MARQKSGVTQPGLAQGGLLSLPDELLLGVLDHIDSHKTLCNLAATCIQLQSFVEPCIWRSLLVLHGQHARKIAMALDNREDRLDYVQELSVRYKDDYQEGIEALNCVTGLMSRLRHLTVETPCPNDMEWRRSTFDGSSRFHRAKLLKAAMQPRLEIPLALPVLQTLNLHAHEVGDIKFKLGHATAMFTHPTLRNITISCLNFDGKTEMDGVLEKEYKHTPLESLTLIECNVNVLFLDTVLRLPKALKQLSIGERLHVFDGCEPSRDASTRTSSPLFLTALQRQAGSLKKLVHTAGNVSHLTFDKNDTDPSSGAKLRSLVHLEHLEVGLESPLYHYLRKDSFPPALKTLKLTDNAISAHANLCRKSGTAVAFKSITSLVFDHLPLTLNENFNLRLQFHDQCYWRTSVAPSELNHPLSALFLDRHLVYRIARVLQSRQSRFSISHETFTGGHAYIPPYMFGEGLPNEEVIYDSERFWHFNGLDYQKMDDDVLRHEMEARGELIFCLGCVTTGREECHNLGDGTQCEECRTSRIKCVYARDSKGQAISAV